MQKCEDAPYHSWIPILWLKAEKHEKAGMFMCQYCARFVSHDDLYLEHLDMTENSV